MKDTLFNMPGKDEPVKIEVPERLTRLLPCQCDKCDASYLESYEDGKCARGHKRGSKVLA